MSFWKKIFSFKNKNRNQMADSQYEDREEIQWDDILLKRENVNIHDEFQRKQYVEGCLEQMMDAEKELHQLNYEYSVVTSHLTDIEELEALPQAMYDDIRETASQVVKIEHDQEVYHKNSHMEDIQFERMQQMEDEVESGIENLKKAEEFHKLVKSDLRKLNGEKKAYQFRKSELEEDVDGYTGMAKICFGAMALCLVVLLILQITLELDARLGYVLMVCVMALVIVNFYIRYNDAQKELVKVEREINRIIIASNRVKIRYVNNKNLLDYLKLKYKVENAKELAKNWEDYQTEKKERELLEQAELDYTFYQKELLKKLRRSRVKDTSVWLHQAAAIVNPKEMVELRHQLIGRRQALRQQMDHNRKLASSSKEELKDISQNYPQYAEEILKLMSKYEAAES